MFRVLEKSDVLRTDILFIRDERRMKLQIVLDRTGVSLTLSGERAAPSITLRAFLLRRRDSRWYRKAWDYSWKLPLFDVGVVFTR